MIELGPFRPADLAALVQVEASASTRNPEARISLAEVPPRDEHDIDRLTNETTVLVAEIDGEVVGYASDFLFGLYLHLEKFGVGRG